MTPDNPYSRPSLKDWALLAVAVAFVVCGLLIVTANRDVGIVTIAFFGPCAALAANTIMRKRRFRRLRPLRAEIVGGVPIRLSRAVFLTYSLTFMTMGVVLVLFGRSYGPVFWAIAWGLAIIGCVLLLGFLSGRLANGYVQFDPEGITIGRRRWAYTVPWDDIERVGAGDVSNNPAVFIWLRDFNAVRVHPAEYRNRALKQLASNALWVGAPIMLLTSQYRIDLPLLMKALERYLGDPSSRGELAPRRTIASTLE